MKEKNGVEELKKHLKVHKWKYLIGALGLLFIYTSSTAELQNTQATFGYCSNEVERAIAEEYYKSPSTVIFQNCTWEKDTTRNITKILGNVDSQNSFGATIRSEVYCEVGGGYNCKITQK